jgi:hypothetical protein
MRLKYPSGQARLILATIACAFISSLTARALNLFEFADKDRRYVFEVASAAPVPASVDQEQVARAALQWAPRFYGAQELDIVDIVFKIKPARFWLVTFSRPGASAPLFAVVLPDGEILDPRVLIGI